MNIKNQDTKGIRKAFKRINVDQSKTSLYSASLKLALIGFLEYIQISFIDRCIITKFAIGTKYHKTVDIGLKLPPVTPRDIKFLLQRNNHIKNKTKLIRGEAIKNKYKEISGLTKFVSKNKTIDKGYEKIFKIKKTFKKLSNIVLSLY
tara:strand:- start:10 stop:453 length:444 start_codon:yes stop_codon:yes gene_type:complete